MNNAAIRPTTARSDGDFLQRDAGEKRGKTRSTPHRVPSSLPDIGNDSRSAQKNDEDLAQKNDSNDDSAGSVADGPQLRILDTAPASQSDTQKSNTPPENVGRATRKSKSETVFSSSTPQERFTHLVFSGGSTRAIAFIGSVRLLQERGDVPYLRKVCGSSAGALISLMLVTGYDADEMQEWATEKLTKMGANQIELDDILDMYFAMGIDKGERLTAFLGEVLFQRFGCHDMSFRDLYDKTKKHLIVCVSNVTKSVPEYLSHETTPELSVVTAVRASMCLPVFFAPVVIHGMLYADGGLFENLPLGGVLGTSSRPTLLDDSTSDAPTAPTLSSSPRRERPHNSGYQSPSNEAADSHLNIPNILAVNVPWHLAKELPSDIVQYSLYLVTSLWIRANAVTALLRDEQRIHHRTDDSSNNASTGCEGGGATEKRDLAEDTEHKRRHGRLTVVDISDDVSNTVPFLGFCVDSMEFRIDKKQVKQHVRRGYERTKEVLQKN